MKQPNKQKEISKFSGSVSKLATAREIRKNAKGKAEFSKQAAHTVGTGKMPSDLSDRSREAIALAINHLAADCFALYVKTKNFHWHLAGSHFRDYHLLFDEQADQLLSMIDVLAERVRKLGNATIRSIGHIKQLQQIQDTEEVDLSATQMVDILLHDNQKLVTHLRHAHQICGENQDVATTSILENYIDEGERRIWFLYQTKSNKQ